MTREKVGILGSGDVGKTLAQGFARHGWDVLVGTRSPESLDGWLQRIDEQVLGGTFEEAARFGDLAVLAVKGEGAENALDLAGSEHFAGSIVIDTTNPLDFSGGMPPGLLYGGTDSLGERVQATLQDARVVKCFNTVSHVQMVDPHFEQETPPMMLCGDDEDAKGRVEELLVDFGWPGALDVGDIEAARYLEALVPLWVRVGSIYDTYEHAFAVVQ